MSVKVSISAILALLLSQPACFAKNCDLGEAKQSLNVHKSDAMTDLLKVNDELDKRFQGLVYQMCIASHKLFDKGETPHKMVKALYEYLNVPFNMNGHKKVTQFWNANHEKFICPSGGGNEKQHLLKRILQHHYFDLYDDFFFDSDTYVLDFNAIEKYNGQNETVIDYLDRIIKTKANDPYYDIDELTDIRDALIEDYGAKRAVNL
jgi:hypothetical protein